jgi:hypothetical protein
MLGAPSRKYPPPDDKKIEEIRAFVLQQCNGKTDGSSAMLSRFTPLLPFDHTQSDATLLSRYTDWLATIDQRWISKAVSFLNFNTPTAFDPKADPISTFINALADALEPGPFQAIGSPLPHFALCALYEQVWQVWATLEES